MKHNRHRIPCVKTLQDLNLVPYSVMFCYSINIWLLLEFFFYFYFFFFKQKTAYEISECDWSSDVCSSDLVTSRRRHRRFLNVTGSEEHTSELQSHSEISYAVFCLRSEERIGRAHV